MSQQFPRFASIEEASEAGWLVNPDDSGAFRWYHPDLMITTNPPELLSNTEHKLPPGLLLEKYQCSPTDRDLTGQWFLDNGFEAIDGGRTFARGDVRVTSDGTGWTWALATGEPVNTQPQTQELAYSLLDSLGQ